jgi:hypothetical protein
MSLVSGMARLWWWSGSAFAWVDIGGSWVSKVAGWPAMLLIEAKVLPGVVEPWQFRQKPWPPSPMLVRLLAGPAGQLITAPLPHQPVNQPVEKLFESRMKMTAPELPGGLQSKHSPR